MKIIDWYILKRYLATFFVMLLMFIPIGIVIDVAEKINKILDKKVPFVKVAAYYGDFTIYFANLLFPIFLFLPCLQRCTGTGADAFVPQEVGGRHAQRRQADVFTGSHARAGWEDDVARAKKQRKSHKAKGHKVESLQRFH